MSQSNQVNLPSGFGGLTRFSEEYESRLNLSPFQIVLFVLLIIGFRVILEFIY